MKRALESGLCMIVVVALGCTRDNPAFGLGELMGATSAAEAGESASSGLEAGTTRDDGTRTGADTNGNGTSGDGSTSTSGETQHDTTTTGTAKVCPWSAPPPFDILTAGASCQTHTWEGHSTNAGHDSLSLSGCLVQSANAVPTCACPQGAAPFDFTFVGLPVDVDNVLTNATETCIAITIAYEESGGECAVEWFGVRTAPTQTGQRIVLAGANREVAALSHPTVTLGSPQCDDTVECDNDGTFLGPHSLGLDYGESFLELVSRDLLFVLEMTVHGITGTHMLQVLHVGVDESCEREVGWVAWGQGG